MNAPIIISGIPTPPLERTPAAHTVTNREEHPPLFAYDIGQSLEYLKPELWQSWGASLGQAHLFLV
jgi:hypothetical protein